MKKALIGLAAGAALTMAAGAANADGYGYGSVKDAPMAAPQVNWNGFYVGAAVGYGIASTEVTYGAGGYSSYPYEGSGGYSLGLDGLSSKGFQGTISLGYDRQIHHNWVLGILGDYTFGDLETSASFGEYSFGDPGPDYNIDADIEIGKITDSWAIGGRIGYIHSCCTMWYVSAGYAQADLETILGNKTTNGWFIGGGVEQQLHGNLFLKLDYRYTNYGKERLAGEVEEGESEGYYSRLDSDTDVHTVRLGVNWKVDLFHGHHAHSEPLK